MVAGAFVWYLLFVSDLYGRKQEEQRKGRYERVSVSQALADGDARRQP